ncbi:GMC oxidoreductase domain-containing protein [Pochonia chlamydosporia 170]|uniref:GMC oxidoreductase domain-containing protein n=1 Tax=Pochonia chlamydosporia 170 TaxID=1380566 RepID=A0A179FXV8_METCM|nr:GMC oxidoreductase domain-containing protein [Pochonia chlamydosporia 170]OAQ70462.1 GMC oxidoreductase domain-containing protein [Pochonia chlamydosporia 170]
MDAIDIGAPTPTPLPDAPAKDFMTDAQWETLYALLDGVLPSITSTTSSVVTDKNTSILLSDTEFESLIDDSVAALPNGPARSKVKEYLEFRPSQDEKFREDCLRSLAIVPQRGQLIKVLNLLGGNAGSMLLTGYWTPITQQPTKVREAILKSWATSRLTALRMLSKSLAQMALKANSIYSPYFSEISGYSDVPKDWKPVDGYDYNFIQVPAGNGVHEITTDVVIVGSGCGGGVSAKNLAEAGHKVLVVDKGYYFPPSQLPMTQAAGAHYLYDAGGVYFTDSASIGIVCGGSWGGGGTVNWSVCFRLQDYVREEWAAKGLPLFTSSDFDDSMDRVWDFIGASKDAIRQNPRNQAVLDGIQKLGWKGGVVEQNTGGKEHYCGQCHLGCGSGEKRGPSVAWLPAAGDAGAEFMEGFAVDRVLFAEDGVTAVGVEGKWTSRDENGGVHAHENTRVQRRVVIKAKKVIISGGSMWSPVILAKSGIKNPNVGKHLHLHPVNFVSGVFGNRDMSSWEGGIITSYVDEFENLDGKGHGVKLEPTSNIPYATYSVQSWRNGVDAKLLAMKYRHIGTFISLTRDRDTGRVYPDPRKGTPRIDYNTSDFDREHTIEGLIALAKICYVSGATEIRPHLQHLEPFVPSDGGKRQAEHQPGKDPEFTDPDFAAWLRELRAADNKPPTALWMSAHQMGSCRMSASEDTGVVDMSGRVWGAKNLYVADASVFPSASGVNPMVTAMALADWISRGVASELDG